MRYTLVFFVGVLFTSSLWAAESGQSDCDRPEVKALRSPKILGQIAEDAKVNAMDCTVLKGGKGADRLLVLYSLFTASGVESRVAVFNRGGLSPEAKPLFLSESIGFDSFLMVAKGKKRMLFVVPGADPAKVVEFYSVTQTDPNSILFKKHKLDLSGKVLSDVADRSWKVDQYLQPKIYSEKGVWKAIIKGKIVDL